jgi:hypothetical protein
MGRTFAQPFFFIFTVIGIVLKIMANKFGVIEMEYTLDDEKVDEYNLKIGAWTILNESQHMWQIVQQAAVSNTKVNVMPPLVKTRF